MLQLFEYILEYLRTVRFGEPDHSLALPSDQTELAQIVREVSTMPIASTASVRQCMQRHLSDNACNGICQTVHATASVRQCMQRHLSDSACVISREWLSMLHDYMKCLLGFSLVFTTEQDRAPAFPVCSKSGLAVVTSSAQLRSDLHTQLTSLIPTQHSADRLHSSAYAERRLIASRLTVGDDIKSGLAPARATRPSLK